MSYIRFLLILVVLINVSSCGFRPLYGSYGDSGTTEDLASIEIKPIADRKGQLLRNHLQDILTPNGRPANPRYTLNVTLNESIERLAISKEAFATRANLFIGAVFTITPHKSAKPIFSGNTKIVSSYNILNSEYATLMSEKNARERSVRELGDNIKTRLSVFFSKQTLKKD